MNAPTEAATIYRQQITSRVLMGRAFLIQTPVCVKLFSNVERWLTTGSLGAVIYGRPRLGKSCATRWTLNALRQVVGQFSWIEIPVRQQEMAHEGAFFQFLLLQMKNRHHNQGTVADRRDRVTQALTTRARRSPIKMVVLFFDEAQQLKEVHYEWLMNMSNELEALGLRLFCLLVGQHKLADTRDVYIADGRDDIVARFMTEAWPFPGIDSLEAVEKCLQKYGTTVYPEGSGQLFPAHFVPKASAGGWAPADTARLFWREYVEHWAGAGREGSPIIPMHYFTSGLVNLLNLLSPKDAPKLADVEKSVKIAVQRSGYKSALASNCANVSLTSKTRS